MDFIFECIFQCLLQMKTNWLYATTLSDPFLSPANQELVVCVHFYKPLVGCPR